MGQAIRKQSNAASCSDQFQPKLRDEAGRLAALRRLEVLDTEPEEPFDNIVNLIRSVLSVPMATVTLVDEHRQWFKARSGISDRETPREDSICSHTIQDRGPLLVSDARLDERFAEMAGVTGGSQIRSYAGIPLTTPDGYNVGALCALDTQVRDFTEAEVQILVNFARIVVNELELRRIAHRDQLTGALTRRGFIEGVESEIARVRRYGGASCLVLLDIDHFKSINDSYGHPAGDAVLRALSNVLLQARRPCDSLGRIGGEEFAFLLPDSCSADGAGAAERFRELIAQTPIILPDGRAMAITASFGIAGLTPSIESAEAWISAADQPLYLAKHAGRNRCATL